MKYATRRGCLDASDENLGASFVKSYHAHRLCFLRLLDGILVEFIFCHGVA